MPRNGSTLCSFPFAQACAPWQYAGLAERAIVQFKYHRHWKLGRWLAQAMAHTAHACLPLDTIEALVPVPSHWLKRCMRGFCPTQELSATLSAALKKPVLSGALRCTRLTMSQTRLSGLERMRNVQGAFKAQDAAVRRRAVLLIDDVLTSGATVIACAEALQSAGSGRIFVLTAARTPLVNR